MKLKSVLAFNCLSEKVDSVRPYLETARMTNCHIDVVVLGVLSPPPIVLHDVAPATEWIERNNSIGQLAEERAEAIRQLAQEAGVSASVSPECNYIGLLEKTMARHCLCSDLFMATKTALSEHEVIGKAFNAGVFHSGCPFLLLPEGGIDLNTLANAVVAWNGKPEAARAAQKSLPLLQNSKQVHVVSIDPDEAEMGQSPGDDVAAYLARHDLKVTIHVLASGGKPIEEKLLQHCSEHSADLLVMGAYGHSRFREWLLGGTTRDILVKTDVPLFMLH